MAASLALSRFSSQIKILLFKLIIALGLILSIAIQAPAQTVVEAAGFEDKVTDAEQRASQWCWAASIQAVLAYYGIKRDQEEIVKATYGRLVNLPASSPQSLYNALNNFTLPDGSNVEIVRSQWATGNFLTAELLYRELDRGHPIIVWFSNGPNSGHSVVIYGAEFMSNGLPITIKIFDPWPGRGFKEINAQPFGNQIVAFFSVRAARMNRASRKKSDSDSTLKTDTSIGSKSRERIYEDCMEGMPEQCVKTCIEKYGNSESVCRSRLCLPTPTNLGGWRSKCRRIANDQ